MTSQTPDRPSAWRFWAALLLTGIGAGLGGAALLVLLQTVQHAVWPAPPGSDLLHAARMAPGWRHLAVLLAAGALTGGGQFLLTRLPSGNGIDITEALWFRAGRLPKRRTLGSAVLSVVIVGVGASLGREGAPKQTGAVTADALCDLWRLPDPQRRLLVACGAGAGMSAAYGVPLGGALFALEVLRGVLALRLVLPALLCSAVATLVSLVAVPNAPTYVVPAYPTTAGALLGALLLGPLAGLASVAFVRAVARADRVRPRGWRRLIAPAVALGAVGAVSIAFPALLGNGRDVAELAFTGRLAPALLGALLLLRPLATLLCLASGAPGGLFTPSLALGALLGGLLGQAWLLVSPATPPGLMALLGAAAVLAATTQGPISAVALILELTGHMRAFLLPLLLAVAIATLVARSLEIRSIYDARLTDAELAERQRQRQPAGP